MHVYLQSRYFKQDGRVPILRRITVILLMCVVATTAVAQSKLHRAGGKPIHGQYIVVFDSGKLDKAPTEIAREKAKQHGVVVRDVYTYVLNGFSFAGNETAALAISNDPRVRFVAEDQEATPALIQSPAPSWGLDRIDQQYQSVLTGNNVYAAGYTGVGTAVYIIDTGISSGSNTTEFGSRIRLTRNWASHCTDVNGCSGEVIDPNDGSDQYNHGSIVASMAAGAVYGVAKDAAIINLRIGNALTGAASFNDMISALNFAVADHANSHPNEPAVANLSFGSDGIVEQIDLAILNTVRNGITVVVGAGNNLSDACNNSISRAGNPASFTAAQNPTGASAITVAATNNDDSFANYSNFGPCVDMLAPGTYSASLTNTGIVSANHSGTSFAAPLVAGVAAIHMQRYNLANNPTAVEGILKDNGTPNAITNVPAGTPNLLLWNGILGKYHACCVYP